MNVRSGIIAAAAASTLIAAGTLSAQASEAPDTAAKSGRWELIVPSGALLPTGTQRHTVKRGNLSALQVAYLVRPALAITSTVAWARSRDIAVVGDPKLDVFTYDVGAEVRSPRWTPGETMTLRSFAGVGGGGRSYDYRKLDVDATHNLSAYASAGGELGIHRIQMRMEARDYVSGFKPMASGGAGRTGNDVVLMVGLRLVTR